MNRVEIFPTSIHYTNIGKETSFIKCKSLLDAIDTDEDCFSTKDTLHLEEPFKDLSDTILHHAGKLFDNLGLKRDSEKVVCMWANISKAHNKHMLHMHPNSYYSAVVYFTCPQPNPGAFGIRDPRQALMTTWWEYDRSNEYSDRTKEIVPEEGLLLLFPSWLEHGVQSGNFSKYERRVSLSCNIMPQCNIEDFTHRYHYQ